MIDDATKTRLSMFFDGETMFGATTVLKMRMERYGIPEPLYCDKKNAFVLTREPGDAGILAVILKPKSRFGKACDRLGIEVMPANSPRRKAVREGSAHGIRKAHRQGLYRSFSNSRKTRQLSSHRLERQASACQRNPCYVRRTAQFVRYPAKQKIERLISTERRHTLPGLLDKFFMAK
jgi:hypothetical protein